VDVHFGEALAGFDERVEDGGGSGGPSCLRASLSGSGLRQSGIVFFFLFRNAALKGPLFHVTSSVLWSSRGRAGLQPGVRRAFKAGFSLCGETRERNAREFAAEVGGVALTVVGVVQDGVDVVEDVPLGDGWVGIVGAELFERPVGDVLAAVGAVFGVGVDPSTA